MQEENLNLFKLESTYAFSKTDTNKKHKQERTRGRPMQLGLQESYPTYTICKAIIYYDMSSLLTRQWKQRSLVKATPSLMSARANVCASNSQEVLHIFSCGKGAPFPLLFPIVFNIMSFYKGGTVYSWRPTFLQILLPLFFSSSIYH